MEHCPKLHQTNAISRRRFLFLGAAAGLTLAVAPAIELAQPVLAGVDYGTLDPFTVVQVPFRQLYARIRISGPVIEASRHTPGAFVDAWNRELAAIAEGFRRQEERHLLRGGRRTRRVRRLTGGVAEADGKRGLPGGTPRLSNRSATC